MDKMERDLDSTNVGEALKKDYDLKVFGEGDLLEVISQVSSKRQGYMKTIRAMEIAGVGTLIQVSTQQGDQVAEALVFATGVSIDDSGDSKTFKKAEEAT